MAPDAKDGAAAAPDQGFALDHNPASAPPAPLSERGWLNLDEASRWTCFSRTFLKRMMKEGRLWYQKYGRRDIRIPKAHLDEQMASGFPVLDIPGRAELRRLLDAPPLMRMIPGPLAAKHPNKPPTRLKLNAANQVEIE